MAIKAEDFTMLYNDGEFILVQDKKSKKYSYGILREFYSPYWFRVECSCLTLDELKAALLKDIEINQIYLEPVFGVAPSTEVYKAMLKIIS